MGKIYNFFSKTVNKNDAGLSKEEAAFDKNMGFRFFFGHTWRRLGKLVFASLIFSLCNFPIFIFLFGLSGNLDTSTTAASSPLYAQLYGLMHYETGPAVSALYGLFGASVSVPVVSAASRILMNSAYLLFLTFGLSNVGLFYCLRGIARGDYVYSWHDYFAAIKKNFRQGFILGILDIVICFLLVYDIFAYGANTGSGFLMRVFYFAVIAFSFIYYVMRIYVYTITVTFDLKIYKIFKNAFLLTSLGIKRNLVGLLGAFLVVVLSGYIYIFLPSIGIVLPIIFTFAFLMFIGVYCAYPVIDKYMIQPYYDEHPDERPGGGEEEKPIFVDQG